MIRILALAFALFATPVLAQTTYSSADLDSNHDGRVELTKPRGPFSPPDVLVRCHDLPAFTYAVICPAAAVDFWTPRIPVNTAIVGKSGYDTHPFDSPVGSNGVVIEREAVANVRQFFVNRWPAGAADGLTIRQARMTCTNTCILIGRANKGGLLQDLDIAAAKRLMPAYATGVKFGEQPASDFLVERVTVRGFRTIAPKGYPNADGFGTEEKNARITFRYTRASDATDGCYDLKGDVILDHAFAARCRYGFRLWGTARATTLYAEDNTTASIYIKPRSDVSIDMLVLTGAVPKYGDLFQDGAGAGARVTIKACSRPMVISHPIVRHDAVLTLGPSCR